MLAESWTNVNKLDSENDGAHSPVGPDMDEEIGTPTLDDELDSRMSEDEGVNLLETRTMNMVGLHVPDWYRNPDFKILFTSADAYENLAALAPLTLADNLSDVLQAPYPPSDDFFLTLPPPEDGDFL